MPEHKESHIPSHNGNNKSQKQRECERKQTKKSMTL
jgi:hypothetical protein